MTDNGWRRTTLADCAIINDSTYSPQEKWPFINYLDTGNITENRVEQIQHLVAGQDKIPSRARRKVQPGDIVYSTVRPNQRHFGILKELPENFLASTGFAVIRGNGDTAETDYLYYFLSQDHIVDHLHTIAEHSTSAYPSIKPRDIASLELSLPPIDEQRRISHILGTLDDKIELNRCMSETLQDMAQALFKSWFVDFDPVRAKAEGRPTGLPPDIDVLFPDSFQDSELGAIPEGWEVGELVDVIDVNPPRVIKRGTLAKHVGMAALPTSGPRVAQWTQRAFTSGSRYMLGDTLLARITPSLENGKTALVDFLEEGEVGWGSTEFIVLRPKTPWPPAIGYLVARDRSFRDHAIVNMTGTSGRQRVPPEAVASHLMVLPPCAIAEGFGRVVEPVLQFVTTVAEQSRTLAITREAQVPILIK
ncbi:MAG: restriction endonuclease subunit S [Chloroflexi bacterium]|nr:restriction endonuclease subunit S [Chloroflexota bacterium]MCY3696692.1 restriction endonuclease subunit S [Chloroflexota bacterium]